MEPKKSHSIEKTTLQNAYTYPIKLPVAIVDYHRPKLLDGVKVKRLTISRINAEDARRIASRVLLHNYFVVADNHPVMVRLIPTSGHYVIDLLGDRNHPHEDLKKEAVRLLREDELADFATLPDNGEKASLYAVVAPRLNLPSLHMLQL